MDAHRIGAGLFEDRPSFLPPSPEWKDHSQQFVCRTVHFLACMGRIMARISARALRGIPKCCGLG